MRAVRLLVAAGVAGLAAADASAGAAEDLFDACTGLRARSLDAAGHVVADDAAAASTALDEASSAAAAARAALSAPDAKEGFGRKVARARSLLSRWETAAGRARKALAAGKDRRAARELRTAAATATDVLALAAKSGGGVALVEEGGGEGFSHGAGSTARIRVVGSAAALSACSEAPTLAVTNDDAARSAVLPEVSDLGPGRFRVVWGPDPGTATLAATVCGEEVSVRAVNLGPPGTLSVDAPRNLRYLRPSAVHRAGQAISPNAVLLDGVEVSFALDRPLPEGLALDPATGTISGTPAASSQAETWTVTASNVRGSAATTVSVAVAPALPPEVASLEEGFWAERVLAGAAVPAKMARLPDGRILYSELLDGNVRVLRADGTLVPEPFATVRVVIGGERGLLGIAVSPEFEEDGHVFVYASVPAAGNLPERNQVLRFTAVGDVGTDPVVVVDSLPVHDTQNAGAVEIGPDGKLYVTVGDTGDPALAQTDGSRAGRVLRYERDGGIPSDNPIAGDPEWCRGLRNAYDLAFHPVSGGLFASENGPTAHDELDRVLAGRNYEWGAGPDEVPTTRIGPRIIDWTPVIVPTGIAFHTGDWFGAESAGSLFVCGYDAADVRRLVLSGSDYGDLDAEVPFARFREEGIAQKPLDCLSAPDGSLWVSTFEGIWRFRKW